MERANVHCGGSRGQVCGPFQGPPVPRNVDAVAHKGSALALQEGRRTHHNRVCSLDQGAVRALALDMAVPVDVVGELPGRPPAPIESAVYFAVAECLANSAKHSGHEHAWVELGHDGSVLHVAVGDDGSGGADPNAGTGMRGVMRRLAAFDGTMSVSSPPGGPTIVTMEVPCPLNASSSPRTTPSSEPG